MGMGTMQVEKYGPIPYLWVVPIELPTGLPGPLLYTKCIMSCTIEFAPSS